MRIAPDIDNPLPLPKDNGGGNGGKGSKTALRIGFMPGQIAGIADDMVAGYGGTDAKWKEYIRNVYDPVRVPYFDFGAKGNGKGGKTGTKDGVTNQGDTNVHPPIPMGMVPSIQGQQTPMQGFLNVGPAGQRMPPTLGLLGAPQQRSAQAGLPPEIQAFLNPRR